MNILVFKTTIQRKKDVEKIGRILSRISGINKWNVDMDDEERILRIETELKQAEIVKEIKKAGYDAEELV